MVNFVLFGALRFGRFEEDRGRRWWIRVGTRNQV